MLVWPTFAAPHLYLSDIERQHARGEGCQGYDTSCKGVQFTGCRNGGTNRE
jgi:hypothetical protein